MQFTPGEASEILGRMRTASQSLNRAQSVFPAVRPALKSLSEEKEIPALIAMMTRVAEVEGVMNRDQMEFITEVRDGLEGKLGWHLAQINIAHFREPVFSTANKEFHDAIDGVNAVAEAAPGFVWRLVEDGPQRKGIDLFEDENTLVNLSVWQDIDSLSAFVYRDPSHKAIMRRRDEWFEHMDFYMVLWWVKAGETPTLADAARRLDLLASRGATEEAFTFKHPFPAPEQV